MGWSVNKLLRHINIKGVADKALKLIEDVMNDEKANTAVRLSAAREMLDRGHGKPVSRTELEATLKPADAGAEDLSDDELARAVKLVEGTEE